MLQDEKDSLATIVAQGKTADDVEPAAGIIDTKAKRKLSLTSVGNEAGAFERKVLAPLMQPGMPVHEELKANIFGSS